MDANYFIEKLRLGTENVVINDDDTKGLFLENWMVKKLSSNELKTLKEIKINVIEKIYENLKKECEKDWEEELKERKRLLETSGDLSPRRYYK